MYIPQRVIMLNIDGLRPDVFNQALQNGKIPHLASIVGGQNFSQGIQFDMVSTAPSITFCCQASIITGAHPREHGITGNQFFDRFGKISGHPRHYVYDIGGHRMAFGDTLAVFLQDLASKSISPDVPTLYEIAAQREVQSTTVFHMYGRGATTWIKPGMEDWRNFFTLNESLGISSEKYDEVMTENALQHLRAGNRPGILHLYYWGLDHTAHVKGPSSEYGYLTEILDPMLGRFLAEYRAMGLMDGALFVIFSDHGQIEVYADDAHCLQLRFPPLDLGIGHLFRALKRDVLDLPGETKVDCVLSMNGGLGHIYIRPRLRGWDRPPKLDRDVLPIAAAFWEATTTGRYYEGLYNALNLILVRNTERDGWNGPYFAYTPQGLVPLAEYLPTRKDLPTLDPIHRLNALSSPNSGDILIFSNYAEGYYFSYPYKGVHGGLHPEDSRALLVYGLPSATPAQAASLTQTISTAIATRCQTENGRQVSLADISYGILAAMDWL
ncbi:MAG: alkaline phosphatase family protein [Anaerolineales bacterium]|nr:alkaline phosphatase family protein [Anaerolineales bacterium]